MDTNQNIELIHKELTEKIIGVFYDVYNELGHGFLESVYQKAMELALRQAGLKSAIQGWDRGAFFRGQVIGEFEADLLVEEKVLLELKAIRELDPIHEAQTLHYLRSTQIELALLMNFGPKPKFRRFAFSNERKIHRPELSP